MAKYTRKSKQKLTSDAAERKPFLVWSIIIPVILILLICVLKYGSRIFDNVSNSAKNEDIAYRDRSVTPKKLEMHNLAILEAHKSSVFGIDISQYQGKIKWDEVSLIHGKAPIDFVFVRATMGGKSVDSKFSYNWKGLKSINKLRGAYHYFRPNENSVKQAQNFIKNVKLVPGDLPPVLDIEEKPRNQSMDSLRVGLKRWLDIVEDHYGVKPIVYSGDTYFTDFLEKEFKKYPLWIANYNTWVKLPKDHWDFWQFSEKGKVSGMKGFVDLNMYRSDIENLESLCIPF